MQLQETYFKLITGGETDHEDVINRAGIKE